MKVLLITGCQTHAQELNKIAGAFEKLSETGEKESKKLSKILKENYVFRIFSSQDVSIVQTTDILEKTKEFEIFIVPKLNRRNNFEQLWGLDKKEAIEKFPELVEQMENNPFFTSELGEDYYLYAGKVIEQFNKILEKEMEIETEGVAFILNLETLKIIFRELIGFEINNVPNCAIFELDFDGEAFEIIDVEKSISVEPIFS